MALATEAFDAIGRCGGFFASARLGMTSSMGVVTAQILILVLGVVLTLVGWMLTRRTMEHPSNSGNALLSQLFIAIPPQSNFNPLPAVLARAAAPSRAPPVLFLRRNRPLSRR